MLSCTSPCRTESGIFSRSLSSPTQSMLPRPQRSSSNSLKLRSAIARHCSRNFGYDIVDVSPVGLDHNIRVLLIQRHSFVEQLSQRLLPKTDYGPRSETG